MSKLEKAFLLWLQPELFPFKDQTDYQAFAQMVAKFMLNELNAQLNLNEMTIEDVTEYMPWLQEYIRYLLLCRHHGILTAKQVKDIFPEAWDGVEPFDIIVRDGLLDEDTGDALGAAANKVIAANVKAVTDYKSGKVSALNSLLGQVMKEMKGKADPNLVRETLTKKLTVE